MNSANAVVLRMSRRPADLPSRTKSEAELLNEGWTRRFVGAPPRLDEMVELYKSLGFEVHLEPQDPAELNEECQDCTVALTFFRVVYTRPITKEG